MALLSAVHRSCRRVARAQIAFAVLLCGLGCASSGPPPRPPLRASPEFDRCLADVRAQSLTPAGCLRVVFDNALPPVFEVWLIHLFFDDQRLIPPSAPPASGAWVLPFYAGRARPGDHVLTAIYRVRSNGAEGARLFEVRARRGFRVRQGQPFTLRWVAYATEVDGEVGLIPGLAAQGDPSWRVSMDDIPPPTPPNKPPRLH